jgi:hypothetical protein
MRNNERLLKGAKTVHVKVRQGTLQTMEIYAMKDWKQYYYIFNCHGNKEKLQKVGRKL